MSPPAGHATSGTPEDSARATVPWPAWHTTASQSGIVREYDSQSTSLAFGGTRRGPRSLPRRFVLANTRTGSSARPSSAACSIRSVGSCDVLGAIRTSGSSPGGGSGISPFGCSQSSGPVTFIHGSHRSRGYSSWGKVAIRASSREVPPCTCSNGGSPTRRRASFSSSRPCNAPRADSGSKSRQKRRGRAKHRVLGRAVKLHALGFHMRAPLLPRLEHHLVPARGKLAPERDHRERVPGVAEGSEEKAAALGNQSSSARVRSMAI